MSNELEAAKVKIALLEEKLLEANTAKQTNAAEDKLETAIKRLGVLEAKYTPVAKEIKEDKEEEEEEDDGDQCPECGGMLYEVQDGVYECQGCGELFEDE